MKPNKGRPLPPFNAFMQKRSVVAFLLLVICLLGLPIRMQNFKLDGYISDDAWWHFRHVREVVESGHRLNPDPYEFNTLSRPMTYPPLMHYALAYLYKTAKVFSPQLSLVIFTNIFNGLEAILYILLIFAFANFFSRDKLFSLLASLAAAMSYGIIIRARAGELMPFVISDLASLMSILLICRFLERPLVKEPNWRNFGAGALMGLAMLSWSGTLYIYIPLALFVYGVLFFVNPRERKTTIKYLLIYFAGFILVSMPWYLPFTLRHGFNPHNPEMSWFMKGFTVWHQVKPLPFYIFTSGMAIFAMPFVFINGFFRKEPRDYFLILWIVGAAIATWTGWRGYVAVVPIISAITLGVFLSRATKFYFSAHNRILPVVFLLLALIVGGLGHKISNMRIAPLEPNNINEVRTNTRSIKMLKYLKEHFPKALTFDHITWVSEDEAVGDLHMVGGQYLEFLPEGSSQVLKDVSVAYLGTEEEAYKIFSKYNAELIIVRRQILQLPQLSLLFAPPELKVDEFVKIIKEDESSEQITMNFTPQGMQSIFFRMLNKQKLDKFDLVYSDSIPGEPLPFVTVYKLKK